MKGTWFYEEYNDKRKRQPQGNVIAIFPPGFISNGLMFEAIGAVYTDSNSPVASTTASYDYLKERCKRIGEKKARSIHPKLFERLDDTP